MAISCSVILCLMISTSSVCYAFLTHVIEDVQKQESRKVHLLEEKELEKEVKERALERLQEVFGLPEMGEKRNHQAPPQFMTELYNDIVDNSGVRRKVPYNANVIRSFIERDNSIPHFFYFNISGLDDAENVLESQLRLYRMRMSPGEMHHTFLTSPSIIIRVYQVLDELHLDTPDVQRLLSSHMVGAYSHGWDVFNVKEAVLDWVLKRRPNKGLLVTTTTMFEEKIDVRFARRNEHHNSKQPILVLFDDDSRTPSASSFPVAGNHAYYKYQSQPLDSSEDVEDPARRRRSLTFNTTTSSNSSTPGACSRQVLYVDFAQIGWSSWIIAPRGYDAYHCKGHCNFPIGQSQKPTNHATVQSIVNELNLTPDVERPCCVPTTLREVNLLFYDDDENVILRSYEDMVAESCGCH